MVKGVSVDNTKERKMTDKERFCELLKGTGRPGVEKVIGTRREVPSCAFCADGLASHLIECK